MFTITRTQTKGFGITSVKVRFAEPQPLKAALTTTTVVRKLDREIGELPEGTLVRELLTDDANRRVWLEVSTDGGKLWWRNERAEKLGPVLEALGVESLAKCDGCGLPYPYASGRDDAQDSRVCRHCQELQDRESAAAGEQR